MAEQAAAARAAAKAAKNTNLERRAAAEQQQTLAGASANGDGADAGSDADVSQPSSLPQPPVEVLDAANGGGPLPMYPDEMTTTQQRIVDGQAPRSGQLKVFDIKVSVLQIVTRCYVCSYICNLNDV